MDGTPVHFALREVQSIFTSPPRLAALVAVAALLGLSGPFGTYEHLELPRRLLYWLLMVFGSYGAGRATIGLIIDGLARRLPNRLWRVPVEALICSVPTTMVVLAINALILGSAGGSLLTLWFYCLVISAVVLYLTGVLLAPLIEHQQAGNGTPGPAETPAAAGAAGPPPILDRLAHPQRGRLLALSVEDHYVEVLTDRGRALLLMRLTDAMRETGSVAGLQIHRSHWVALDAVARVVRANGRVSVELADGARLPVSRGYLPAARAAGLLA